MGAHTLGSADGTPPVPPLPVELTATKRGWEELRVNPKRAHGQGHEWYPYYAGFSVPFVHEVLARFSLPQGATILDPWNGSGTTTACAVKQGYRAVGIDINPAMSLLAAGRLCSPEELDTPLAAILNRLTPVPAGREDPLAIWFGPRSAGLLRALARRTLALRDDADSSRAGPSWRVAGFYFAALARTVRLLLKHEESDCVLGSRSRARRAGLVGLIAPRRESSAPPAFLR